VPNFARFFYSRSHYNMHIYLLEVFRVRRESRDAAHALKMLGIDMRVHRAVLVDKRVSRSKRKPHKIMPILLF
jgi:hypothetical protein